MIYTAGQAETDILSRKYAQETMECQWGYTQILRIFKGRYDTLCLIRYTALTI